MKKYLLGFLILAVALGAVVFLKVRAQQCDTKAVRRLSAIPEAIHRR